MSKFFREKIQNIDGQETKLYYKGEMPWTRIFSEKKLYQTRAEANEDFLNKQGTLDGWLVEIPTGFIIEKTQKIQGQEKKLYYKGEMNWTTVFGQRRLYETREEAEKDNDVFIRDVLNIHRDTSGSIVSEDFG